MTLFTLEFYRLPNGKQPVKEFLSSIDNLKLRAKVYRKLKQLEDFGITLREPDSKALGEGIFELRVKQSSNIARCLYFFYYGETIVVTNGFIKKQRKTPRSEIELALERKAEYENRKAAERTGPDDPIRDVGSSIPKGMERNGAG
ncbi:MAG: type II toxin-antitoxin system RelE/ParE family toxin [Firmicutes bacterium]|nr:type II toxin-antitoxin system RelE/ParE family toxin [Bacillota bacterium]